MSLIARKPLSEEQKKKNRGSLSTFAGRFATGERRNYSEDDVAVGGFGEEKGG